MDVTLKHYLKQADDIHAEIVLKKTVTTRKVKNSLYELESFIKQIQSVSCRIAQIYNLCKKTYNEHVALYRNPISLNTIDMLEKDSWTTLVRHSNTDTIRQLFVAPNIPIEAHVVNQVDEIPNMPLYWIKSLNQFAIRINGTVFRGNVGNIYVKNSTRGNIPVNVSKCKYVEKCPQLLSGKRCKFYHDIESVNALHIKQKITDATLELYKNTYQNFNNMSWLYVDDAFRSTNSHMRFVGNRNTLRNDIEMSKFRGVDWVDGYKSQMFHDFLVMMAINQMGLNQECPYARMVSEDYSGQNELVRNLAGLE